MEFWRHAWVGAWTYIATLALMYVVINWLRIPELIGYAIVQFILFLLNFTVTRNWVFRYEGTNVGHQLARFALASLVFRGLNWVVYSYAWNSLGIAREIAVIIAIAVLYPAKFLAHKTLVFGRDQGR